MTKSARSREVHKTFRFPGQTCKAGACDRDKEPER